MTVIDALLIPADGRLPVRTIRLDPDQPLRSDR